jgi:4a-hydroxytetrahydrobiopterin dehydratase
MPQLLDEDQIAAGVRRVEWSRRGDEIARHWKFADFKEAIEFVNRVAAAAEESNHHPDILVHGYNQVRLSLSTHSAGGLTAADFEMAEKLNQLS